MSFCRGIRTKRPSGRPKEVRPTFYLLTAAILFGFVGPAAADTRLPLVFHVAETDDGPVADDDRLDAYVALANHHFRGAGVDFERGDTRGLPEGSAVLETIRDRRRLARRLVARRINVFVVDQILDPVPSLATERASARVGLEPSGRLGGAHIRVRGRVPETYIIISRRSHDLVLTHELGHFLGAPHHRDPTNIMSYGRTRTEFSDANSGCLDCLRAVTFDGDNSSPSGVTLARASTQDSATLLSIRYPCGTTTPHRVSPTHARANPVDSASHRVWVDAFHRGASSGLRAPGCGTS